MAVDNSSHFTVAVCGSAGGTFSNTIAKKAYEIGKYLATQGCILFSGATLGYSCDATRGAHDTGGLTIGISPAENLHEQLERYEHIDPKLWNTIVYTGIGYKARDVVMMRSIDAAILIGGGVGTLLELTLAIDFQKVIGILDGSGGAIDLREQVAAISHRHKPSYIVSKNPKPLVENVISELKRRAYAK
ncbi:LOG family protein [Candidatus Gottesmanbacteria bacterium]|nr:LOG family protein [Candidatus Gottesmanbacteria bacterium]